MGAMRQQRSAPHAGAHGADLHQRPQRARHSRVVERQRQRAVAEHARLRRPGERVRPLAALAGGAGGRRTRRRQPCGAGRGRAAGAAGREEPRGCGRDPMEERGLQPARRGRGAPGWRSIGVAPRLAPGCLMARGGSGRRSLSPPRAPLRGRRAGGAARGRTGPRARRRATALRAQRCAISRRWQPWRRLRGGRRLLRAVA